MKNLVIVKKKDFLEANNSQDQDYLRNSDNLKTDN